MAKLNFDVPDASGGPTITHSVDFDTMTPEEAATYLGLDAAGGKKLKAAVAALAPDAAAQATLGHLVAAGIKAAETIIRGGGSTAGLLAGLLG